MLFEDRRSKSSSPHNIQVHQISVQTHITLVFTSFKHHQGPPFTLTIPPSPSSTSCPVALVSTYLGVRGRSPGPLFAYPDMSPISPSRFRTLLKMSLSFSSIPSSKHNPPQFPHWCCYLCSIPRPLFIPNTGHG